MGIVLTFDPTQPHTWSGSQYLVYTHRPAAATTTPLGWSSVVLELGSATASVFRTLGALEQVTFSGVSNAQYPAGASVIGKTFIVDGNLGAAPIGTDLLHFNGIYVKAAPGALSAYPTGTITNLVAARFEAISDHCTVQGGLQVDTQIGVSVSTVIQSINGDTKKNYGIKIEDVTGGSVSNIALKTGIGNVIFGGPVRMPVYSIGGTLPAGTIGDRAFVNNALAPVFGSTAVAGGIQVVPVYCDGLTWKVG